MQRGQTAIEFIFIILIITLYVYTVTLPLVVSSESAFTDIASITKTNHETLKLVNTIERVTLLGVGSKEIIFITLPPQSTIVCYNDGNIGFIAPINTIENVTNPSLNGCSATQCDKNYSITSPLYCSLTYIMGQQKVKVEKTATTIEVTVG